MEDNCLAVAPSACVHGVYESLQHSFAGFHPTAVCPQRADLGEEEEEEEGAELRSSHPPEGWKETCSLPYGQPFG